jgi:hypothetical protein
MPLGPGGGHAKYNDAAEDTNKYKSKYNKDAVDDPKESKDGGGAS